MVMDGLETTVATWGALEAAPAVETVGSVVKGVVVTVPAEYLRYTRAQPTK